MKSIIIAALCALTLVACNKSQKQMSFENASPAGEAAADLKFSEPALATDENGNAPADKTGADLSSATIQNIESKIIRNASIRMQVEKIASARKALLSETKKLKGYLESEHQSNNNYNSELQLTLRIPNTEFEKFLDASTSVGSYVESKDITTEDVTDTYVDLSARLKTKKEVHARYLEFLKRANKIQDVLEVENEIRQLQEEIESTEARLRVLNDKVSYSTIQITVYELKPVGSTPQIGYISKLGTAFMGGWNGLMSFTIGVVHLWPFILILAIVLFIIRRKWRMNKAERIQK